MAQEKNIYYKKLHHLSMATGMAQKLVPMLRIFAAACIRELDLRRIDFYMSQNIDGEHVLPDNDLESHLVHTLGMPEEYVGLINRDMFLILQELQQQECGFLQSHDKALGVYLYHFYLDELGLISLQTLAPLAQSLLLNLAHLISKLAIDCRNCINFEALDRIVESSKASEDIISFQLYHDELTNLPNRRMLMNQLSKDIARSMRHNYCGAVLFLDLNRFKVINDTFGHSTGDDLLVCVAQILQSIIRKEDTVARLSGDEFVILLSRIKDDRKTAEIAIGHVLKKIKEAFSVPLRVNDHTLHVTPSIGVEIYPNQNASADTILHHADIAMYQAKSQGPNVAAFFDRERSDEVRLRLELENELKASMSTMDQFRLYYQPQYDGQGQCVGAEALVRWEHPAKGFISPGLFVPIAEETGLMLKLGAWVMQEACKHLAQLESRGLPETFKKLSINVSAIQFVQKNFVHDLLTNIRYYGVDRNLLGVELTESLLIKNVEDSAYKITELKKEGITTSIDDFGTGYSSLAYLTRFPIDTLKIDQMFVRNMDTNTGNRAVIDTIMVLGKNLKLSIIAEGVETEEELKCLREFNCEIYQGYYFEHPQPFDDFIKVLDNADAHMLIMPDFPFRKINYHM